MAFGGLRGTLTGFGTSIVTPETADGSVVVSVQDLIIVMVAEGAANTVTTVTDNLGQTYAAINAGTLSSVGLRGYYRYVTVAGTLTQVSCVMTSSANDHAISVAVFEGPFTSTPLDRAPANTVDAATPFTCAATTVLSQANELIVAGLGLIRGQTAQTATAPLLLAVNAASAAADTANSVSATIGRQIVAATTAVTPAFASAGTIAGGVQIVATFRQSTPSGDFHLVSSYTPGADRINLNGDVGLVFFVGAADATFNHIGLRCATGNTGLHKVTLRSNLGNVIEAEANVDLTGGIAGQYYYVPIAPVTLRAGIQYYFTTLVNTTQYWSDQGPTTLAIDANTVYTIYRSSGGSWTGYLPNTQFAGVDLALISAAANDAGQGLAAAVATMTAVGRVDFAAIAAALGTGTASSVGRADILSAGSAAALGAAAGTSSAGLDVSGAGASSAVGLAGAVSRSDVRSIAASAATGVASGASSLTGLDSYGAGASAGTGLAAATARSDVRSIAASAASGVAAAGVGRLDARSPANAAATGVAASVGRTDSRAVGNAAALGFARAVMLVVGQAAGTSNAQAAGRSDVRRSGVAVGIGLADALAKSDARSVAISVSLGSAVSFSVEPGSATKTIRVTGHMPARLELTGHVSTEITLAGQRSAVVSLTGNAPVAVTLTGHRADREKLTGDMGV